MRITDEPPDPEVGARVILALTNDAAILRGLDAIRNELGFELVHSPLPDDAPAVVVIDLETPGSIEKVATWRRQAPSALIAGHLASPRRDLWREAESAGCDIVTSRFALVLQVRRRLTK